MTPPLQRLVLLLPTERTREGSNLSLDYSVSDTRFPLVLSYMYGYYMLLL